MCMVSHALNTDTNGMSVALLVVSPEPSSPTFFFVLMGSAAGCRDVR